MGRCHGGTLDIYQSMRLSRAVLLLFTARVSSANFVGPFGPRTGASTGTASAEPPQPAGSGFTREEVRSLLRHRHALVLAGEDLTTALEVAEGLADVGASVVVACANPDRAQRRVERINAKARAIDAERAAAAAAVASMDAAGDDVDAITSAAAEGTWRAGCEVRPLDLSSQVGVCAFADERLSEGRPLHVLINCADDRHALYRAPSGPDGSRGWELTAGRNHLGPFLVTQLLLDQVVETMRTDAATEAEAERAARLAARRAGRAPRRSGGAVDGRRVEEAEPPLRPRPYPAPLGRCITLGLDARLGELKPGAAPPALGGLRLVARNYTGWRAYRCAHEANTLATLQLARMLPAVRMPKGEHIESNVVRPSRLRWLPQPLRRVLRAADGAALTATFLASTPMGGLNGLFFSDFATEPAWRKSAKGDGGPAVAYAAKQLYASSMARVGAPPADWRSEATMLLRGQMATQRRPQAQVRGRRDEQRAPLQLLDPDEMVLRSQERHRHETRNAAPPATGGQE